MLNICPINFLLLENFLEIQFPTFLEISSETKFSEISHPCTHPDQVTDSKGPSRVNQSSKMLNNFRAKIFFEICLKLFDMVNVTGLAVFVSLRAQYYSLLAQIGLMFNISNLNIVMIRCTMKTPFPPCWRSTKMQFFIDQATTLWGLEFLEF